MAVAAAVAVTDPVRGFVWPDAGAAVGVAVIAAAGLAKGFVTLRGPAVEAKDDDDDDDVCERDGAAAVLGRNVWAEGGATSCVKLMWRRAVEGEATGTAEAVFVLDSVVAAVVAVEVTEGARLELSSGRIAVTSVESFFVVSSLSSTDTAVPAVAPLPSTAGDSAAAAAFSFLSCGNI